MPTNPPKNNNKPSAIKSNLHPRNKNINRYDLDALKTAVPALEMYVKPNKYGSDSIDFADPKAVKLLNQALLKHYYGIDFWNFPEENLTPPIPGRADYLHYIADLLAVENEKEIPTGNQIKGLDIGVGASAIYPIIGVKEYGWKFIGSDISDVSLASAQQIIDKNETIKDHIELRKQEDSTLILSNILEPNEKIDFIMSNPPFHATQADAKKESRRKIQNLTRKKISNPPQNFAGIHKELVYKGGEYQFIKIMIKESKDFSDNCMWFTTLVSKQSNVSKIRNILERSGVVDIRTIKMGTGNKSTRIMAWTYLSKADRRKWTKERWS
ncbi:23S rRNA (adenine(1618)-N(6))-methyltransferase RlmF [Flavobacteriaceae bacterium Ap0902]|nr:23S rRNA (adenine(1618)-N(6))-methyltransferase RlmF [Flavobacteriaceae bacterium Ap0902]